MSADAGQEPVRRSIIGCVPIAHRGGPTATVDENTVAAITRDGRLGAWAELDLRRLKTGEFVLLHDATLKRTTTGWGPVEEQTIDYIRSLRTVPNGQPVPTLEEALIAAKRSGATLYIELKRYENLYWKPQDLQEISKLVHAHRMQDRVYIGGTRGALKDLRDYAPSLRAFWRTKNNDQATVAEARKRSVEVVQTYPGQTSAAAVKRLKADGYTVAAQSMNRPTSWLRAKQVGIRAVQTNNPLAYRSWCRTHGS